MTHFSIAYSQLGKHFCCILSHEKISQGLFNFEWVFQNKDAGDSDSEAEMEQLEEFESVLREYDQEFKRYPYLNFSFNCSMDRNDSCI